MIKKFFKESLIYGLSRYIGKFIGVFLLPLYTSVLIPEDYGILDLLGTVSIVSLYLVVSGTDSAISYFYYKKEYQKFKNKLISSALWIRIFFSVIVFVALILISPYLSGLLFGRKLLLFFLITGLTIIFNSVYSFLYDLLRFEFRPWFYTVISVGGILLNILLTIYFVLVLRKGVYGALIASAIAYFFFFIITIIYVFRKYGMGFSFPISRRLLKYGIPLIGTGLAIWILTSSDRYFIAHYADLTAVGIYAVGMKLANFLGMIGGTIQLAWGPFAMSIQYNEDAKETYSKIFSLFFLLNLLGVFFISMFAIDILKVFTQPAYYNAKAVVPFLCFSTIFWAGYFIVAIGINITKKLQHTVWITVLAAVINILLNFIITPIFGAVGAAFCFMIANLFILTFTYFVSQKYYHINYKAFGILAYYFYSFIIIGITYYFDFNIILRIIISIIYFITLFIYLHKISLSFPMYREFFRKLKLSNT